MVVVSRIHHMRRLILAMLAMLATALPSFARDASLLLYNGPDRAQKILAAAKEEGSLTLYTSLEVKNLQYLIPPFEKKYGIKVNVWRAGTSMVLQRTMTEAAAGRYVVDVIHFGAPQLEALAREKILQPVQSPLFSELMAAAVPAHHEWAGTILQLYVQAYNTKLIKKADLPKTYEDLLDPKWKGKLGIEAKSESWYATLLQAMGEEKGKKLFHDIVTRNGMSVRYGYSLLDNLVIAGEVPLALTVYQHMPQAAKEKGAPIDWFALKPTIARFNGIGIARHAPHPNAALLFYDYMLSSTGAQKAFAAMGYVPANTKLPSNLGTTLDIKLVDPVEELDHVEKWNKSFDEVFGNGGG